MILYKTRKDISKFEKNVIKLKNCGVRNKYLSGLVFITRVHLLLLKQIKKNEKHKIFVN